MASDRNHSEAGFTLVEVAVATALTLVVMLMGYGILHTSTSTANAVGVRSVNSANAREAIDAIDTNLRSATGVWVCAGLPTATTCASPTAITAVASWTRTSAATLFVTNASQPTCDAWTISSAGLQEDHVSGSTATPFLTVPGVMAWVPPLGNASTTQTPGFAVSAAGQLVVTDLLVNSSATMTATSGFDTADAVSAHNMTSPNNVPTTPVVALSSALSISAATTILNVGALATALPIGLVTVTSGINSQIFTTTIAAAAGATTITVSSITPNFAYPTTSTVSWATAPPLRNC